MIKKILKKKTSLAIFTLLVIMIFGITINQSLAYFTAYCDAWGSKTLSLSRTTELNEDIVDNNKEISIKNTSEAIDIYTRVKIFFADDPRLTVSVEDLGTDNYWSYNESDEYWYYTKPLSPQESTEILKANVEAEIEEGMTSSLEVIVIHEYVTALYNEDGSGNMNLSWEYGLQGGNE